MMASSSSAGPSRTEGTTSYSASQPDRDHHRFRTPLATCLATIPNPSERPNPKTAHGMTSPSQRRGHPARRSRDKQDPKHMMLHGASVPNYGRATQPRWPGLTAPLARPTWTPRRERNGSTRDLVTRTTKDAAGLPGSGHDSRPEPHQASGPSPHPGPSDPRTTARLAPDHPRSGRSPWSVLR